MVDNNKMTPLVSVLMTAYNREKYISEAIESVLISTFTDFELIILDDASIDSTFKIAKSYAAKDSRIRVYINDKNLGDYPNRNKVASYAKGTYLKYVDSDDKIYPHTLKVMVDFMEMNPDAALGISSRYKSKPPFGQYLKLIPEEAYRAHFFDFGFLDNGPSFTIIRRSVFNLAKGFGEKRNVSDFEMWLKIASKHKVLLLPGNLIEWRQHEDQEVFLAPECYLEHNYSILKNALSSDTSPLTSEESGKVLKEFKKMTLSSIIKFCFVKGNFNKFIKLMKSNGFRMKDFMFLFK